MLEPVERSNLSECQTVEGVILKNVKPGGWHNGCTFIFCPSDCKFESEPSPTSADAFGEVTGCPAGCQEVSTSSTRAGSWVMYITFTSTKK